LKANTLIVLIPMAAKPQAKHSSFKVFGIIFLQVWIIVSLLRLRHYDPPIASVSSPPILGDTMPDTSDPSTPPPESVGFRFQVFGKVQGVSFRKYTQRKATEFNISGWIRNTNRGTVEGEVACHSFQSCNRMKVWLQSEGSLRSDIDHAEFTNLDPASIQAMLKVGTFAIRKSSLR
jgi:acylphosphatase